MDDARLVRLADGLAGLDDVEHGLVDGERPSLLQAGAEVGPLQVLHDDVGGPRVEAPHVVHLGDVLALEAGRRPRLAEEALHGLGLVERLSAHELDGPELAQVEVGGRHHDAHGAPAEDPLHPVLAGDDVSEVDVQAAFYVVHGTLNRISPGRRRREGGRGSDIQHGTRGAAFPRDACEGLARATSHARNRLGGRWPSRLAPTMRDAPHDYVLVGGGLSSGLLALALAARRPAPRLTVVEQGDRLGGNHTWCFHDADVPPSLRAVVEPLVVTRWGGYSVRFPGRERRLAAPYSAVTSDRLDTVVRAQVAVAGGAVMLRRRAVAVGARHVVLDDGEVIDARAVIDARGPVAGPAGGSLGYQKFVGLELVLGQPHGLTEPVLMDATVEQLDGYRFVYVLPLAVDRLLVEDTYFSDGPALDVEALRARVLRYASAQGLHVERIAREETGVLPMPWRGGPSPRAAAPLVAGYRGGFFHPGPATRSRSPRAWPRRWPG